MFNRKKLTALGTTGVAALALVGVGTGAQWADQVTGTENLSTGTVDLRITGAFSSSPGAIVEISPDGQSVTFTQPLEDASFIFAQDIYVANVGTLDLKRAWYTVSVTGDPELTDNVWTGINDVYDSADNGYGYASTLNGYESPGYAMPAGAATTVWFDFSTYGYLPDAAQGKTMQVTVTVHGLDGEGGNAMATVPETRS